MTIGKGRVEVKKNYKNFIEFSEAFSTVICKLNSRLDMPC
jgi:hypothetical protein